MGGAEGEIVSLGFKTIFGEDERRTAEGVGLNDVGTGGEIGAVDIVDDVGAGFYEVLVAAFERGSTEIRSGKIAGLKHGAHGPVEGQDAGGERVFQRPVTVYHFHINIS